MVFLDLFKRLRVFLSFLRKALLSSDGFSSLVLMFLMASEVFLRQSGKRAGKQST